MHEIVDFFLEAAGFKVGAELHNSGAAFLHQEHGDPLPSMSWPTNYDRLASATMFRATGLLSVSKEHLLYLKYVIRPDLHITHLNFLNTAGACCSIPLQKLCLQVAGLFWAGDLVAPGIKDNIQGGLRFPNSCKAKQSGQWISKWISPRMRAADPLPAYQTIQWCFTSY